LQQTSTSPGLAQDSATPDETDLALIHALQIAPRSSWTLIGRVLGISATTASRRWDRLVGDGLAWVTCLPGPALWAQHVLAFVDVDCEPAALPRVVEALTNDPRVATVEVTTGTSDLMLTVFAADLPILSHLVINRIGCLEGVRGVRTRLGTGVYAQGAGWRLDALTSEQQSRLGRAAPPPRATIATPQASDRELLLACAVDGRLPAAELAERTGRSPSTVRRHLARLVRDRIASFRCEVAEGVSGWPISATFFASVPPDILDSTARMLAGIPEVRLCAAVSGGLANLVVTAWLRSLADSQRLEALLTERFPALVINDRATALRIPKRIGWRLDPAGRPLHAIPIDLWHEADTARVPTPVGPAWSPGSGQPSGLRNPSAVASLPTVE
jgi:DNA-binding Lrp family transcriptional regulator